MSIFTRALDRIVAFCRKRRTAKEARMGGAQSAERDPHQLPDQLQRELDSIRDQLKGISVPDHIDELADIIPYYSRILARMNPQTSLQQVATTYMMVNSHAEACKLSRVNNTLAGKLEECKTALKQLHADILVSKKEILELAHEEAGVGGEAIGIKKEDDHKELSENLAHLSNAVKDLQMTYVDKLKTALEQSDKLNVMLEESFERNAEIGKMSEELLAKNQSDWSEILAFKAFHRDAQKELQTVEDKYKTLEVKYDTCLAMFQDLKTRTIKLSQKDKETLASVKNLNDQIAELSKDCEKKDASISDLDAEVKLLSKATEAPGTLTFHQIKTARAEREVKDLRQREVGLKLDLEIARKKVDDMTALFRERARTIDSAIDLARDLERLEANNRKLKEERDKTGDLRKEIRGLKEKLKEQNVKHVEEQLRQARAELQEVRSQLKDKDTPGELLTTSAIVGADFAESENVSTIQNISFDDGAFELFKRQKAMLRELQQNVTNMTEPTLGGSGWSIVERADSMVDQKTKELIKEIDDCLALRAASQKEQEKEAERVEQLEAEGFPTLTPVVSEAAESIVANERGGLTRKKSKKKKNKGKAT